LHDKKLPGRPDIVLKKYKTAVFVNGCFWHGHENCKHFRLPKSRTEWWRAKIEGTKKRDAIKSQQLLDAGWQVVTVWECENVAAATDRIEDILKKQSAVYTS